MKIVVDSMPVYPCDCLFCENIYTDMCSIAKSLCYLSPNQDRIYCPYLIELQVKEGDL